MRTLFKLILTLFVIAAIVLGAYYAYTRILKPNRIPHTPPSPAEKAQLIQQKQHARYLLGSNTNEIREDNASIPFLDLFKSSIPFPDTHPWLSSKDVIYDAHGWPTDLKGGVAGTKFLNRLPEGTVANGQYTVLYDGEGELQYGNDAKLVKTSNGKHIISIQAGKDKILNASVIIRKTNLANPLRNIRILPSGGICQGNPYQHVNNASKCQTPYLAFENNYQAILFNPDYLNFMKDFRLIRFMNMAGMTRNPINQWEDRNRPEKSTWAGKEGTRGTPVEVMVSLANQLKADAWFSMPYQASNDYIKQFAEYTAKHLNPSLKVYIEYSNEVWNNIFIHRRYTINQGIAQKLDQHPETAGIKFYAKRSTETFKLWENAFNSKERLVRVLSGWSANHRLTSQLLSYNGTHKHVDVFAVAPYFYASLESMREAKNVDDIFEEITDNSSRYGLPAIIKQIKKQVAITEEFGVELVAYEGGQHLVDWETRTAEQHPNPLLYAANRDKRMGAAYSEYLTAWNKAGGKSFVHFSAPRIYSWYGSWGAKEFVTQKRSKAPKYDALLRYIDK
ncbi:hypothetical protein [Leucothrix arctica]|uniref:Cellulose-binding protein n=1 Tax=Leucothrix arctica TaxID=1481894 RepID=A0A317CKE5_9GAMM|nr:hypothetical protein [Leucothrix arctica]PWQ98976.1 hypothetical protein DKT75_02125 [Leucothrix arctica]